MKKFKLMQIVPALNSGGVEQGAIDVANYLAEYENNSIVVSSGGRLIEDLNKKYIFHYKLSVNSKNFLKMPFIAKKINKIIKEKKINILHIRSRAPAWLLPYIDKKELITISTFHNLYNHQNIIKKIYNKGLAKTDYIVAISKYVGEEIIKQYKISKKKITIINRGIDIDFYNAKKPEETELINFINKKKIDSNKKNILFPGRLTEWKGQLEFLKIIEKFKDQSYQFYFAGDDKNVSYTKKLINQIEKKKLDQNCKILGHLNNNDLKMMYYCSDLVISAPLRAEGFGRIISESLAMKKIVIAYNFGGVKDQLKDLNEIYKIIPFDQEELKKRIQLILDSPNENFEKIKYYGREHVIKYFSKKQMLKKYYNLYKDVSFE